MVNSNVRPPHQEARKQTTDTNRGQKRNVGDQPGKIADAAAPDVDIPADLAALGRARRARLLRLITESIARRLHLAADREMEP